MKYEATIKWRDALSTLLICFGIIFYSYFDTLQYLFGLWGNFDDGEYAHGWLIIAVVAYLVWDKRTILAKMQPKLDIRPIAIIPVIGFFWLVAALADINLVQTISVILIMMLCVWFALGYGIAKELLFAMLFIFFATPAWLPLQTVFQTFTVHAAHYMLIFMDIPVIRDGYLLIIPEGSFAVYEGCSGLRYFLVAFALSTLFSYLNFYSFKIRLLYVLLFLMASLLANWIRVFVVIYAGHLTQMKHPYVTDHVNLGWYIFMVMVAALYWIGYKYLTRWDAISPEKESKVKVTSGRMVKAPMAVVSLLLVSMLLVAPSVVSEYLGTNVNAPSDEARMPYIEGWTELSLHQGELVLPSYKNSDLTIASAYQDKFTTVQAAVSYYSSSRRGVSLIDYNNHIVDRDLWSSLTADKNHQIGGSQIKEVLIRSKVGDDRVVWYWYRVGGMGVSDKYKAKIVEVLGIMAGRADSALIMISASYNVNPDEARAALASFYKEARPSLDGFVDALAGG